MELSEYDLNSNVYVPVLDDPITTLEVEQQIKIMKADKAGGPDGLPQGIFKLLPAQWILFLTNLFNRIFYSAMHPRSWATTKLVTIFKKGSRDDVKNYRGISLMNSIAKLYDMILYSRLKQWYIPHREQAGCQEKRSCLEHIVTLRLLCDTARRKKLKLYVTFVDFSQAYDRVPRNVLFKVLKRLGCGAVMLSALVAVYTLTESWLGPVTIVLSLGVRQGAPTSCILFIIFVDELIKLVKECCGLDGFLRWLHILVLMDDTVLLATSRDKMIDKIKILQEYCIEYGMRINESKTKFFVINGDRGDQSNMVVEGLKIEHCNTYIYLGSPFTSDGNVSSAVKVHAKNKMPHVLKFISFLNKNNDAPFTVKKRVFEAALMSSLVYGCESWLGADLRPVKKIYNWCLKKLMGVRKSTSNNVCYIESGYSSLNNLVIYKQHKFFHSMWRERTPYTDDPLRHVMTIVLDSNTPTTRILRDFVNQEVTSLGDRMESIKNEVRLSSSSRSLVYMNINASLSVHDVYKKKNIINEHHRIAFTRFRVCGHSLACETGRWNRRGRGRLPMEMRLCGCGSIQTELHVAQECPSTQHIRDQYQFTSLDELMSDHFTTEVACEIIYKLLSTYQ